jgi:superfamily II DNA or RNA helicase
LINNVRQGNIIKSSNWPEPVEIKFIEETGEYVHIVGATTLSREHIDQIIPIEKFSKILIERMDSPFSIEPWKVFLALETIRYRFASIYDPLLAMNTSKVDPLPHQIEAVYGYVLKLPRIRFLIADDPGAGKTIMAGLIIKELKLRHIIKRILIVAPGHLKDQWQRELSDRFEEKFVRIDREILDALYGENVWMRENQIITSIDFAKREEVIPFISAAHFDLIVVDEAHKMSAYHYGDKTERTERYKLGEALSRISEHLLFLTATPHKGDPENFRLFLDLLEPGFFATNEMRHESIRNKDNPLFIRRVKEDLKDFEGKPLFLPRYVKTIVFNLGINSPKEKELYNVLSEYVNTQYNVALTKDKKRNVAFALVILQRRLASSTYALHESLVRRKKKLQDILEGVQEKKILIFTESRDTLEYLEKKTREWGYLTNTIHGGMKLEDRIKAESVFKNETQVLVATEAAGEGINLQFCHLMLNYDIPWNPNRLEQRMGRIHRYGQHEEVYVFNLVAEDTREGMVVNKVFQKIEEIKRAMGDDKVFDVISEVLYNKSLSQLLMEAAANARKIDDILKDLDITIDEDYIAKVKENLGDNLATRYIDYTRIKEMAQKAREYRLIPEYTENFFKKAFVRAEGKIKERNDGFLSIESIPYEIRRVTEQDNFRKSFGGLLKKYPKVTFDKEIAFKNPDAEFFSFGHPLFEAVMIWIENNFSDVLLNGATFSDPDGKMNGYILFYEGEVNDGKGEVAGKRLFGFFNDGIEIKSISPGIIWELAEEEKEERKNEYEKALIVLKDEIQKEKSLTMSMPRFIGIIRVIPSDRIEKAMQRDDEIERIGMEVAMEYERRNGRVPEDVADENLGFDIRSIDASGKLRYIEVKARAETGAVALTQPEWFKALRFKDDYYLYTVMNAGGNPRLYFIQNPSETLEHEEKVEVVRFIVPFKEIIEKGEEADRKIV